MSSTRISWQPGRNSTAQSTLEKSCVRVCILTRLPGWLRCMLKSEKPKNPADLRQSWGTYKYSGPPAAGGTKISMWKVPENWDKLRSPLETEASESPQFWWDLSLLEGGSVVLESSSIRGLRHQVVPLPFLVYNPELFLTWTFGFSL